MKPDTNLNIPPDIYRMKREKSRAGCLAVLLVMLVLLVLGAAFGFYQWWEQRGTESADPVEFPDAPVEADPPPVSMPELEANKKDAEMPISAPPPPAEMAFTPASSSTPPPPPPPPSPDVAADSATATAAPPPPVPPATPAIPEPLPAPSGGDADALMTTARERSAAGDTQGARQAALEAWDARPGDAAIEQFLSDLAMPLLISTRPMPEKMEYTVQSGDFLGKLAATYNTPVALIAKANDIRNANIRVGQRLLFLDGRKAIFAVKVSKTRNDLVLTLNGRFFKRYRVSTGTNARTPVGVFKIIDKIAQPTWFRAGGEPVPYGDPDNLLGTHWLALDSPGYGLHGTWEPDSIGKQSSAGCVRLLNADIEELYSILPKGTVVTIVE